MLLSPRMQTTVADDDECPLLAAVWIIRMKRCDCVNRRLSRANRGGELCKGGIGVSQVFGWYTGWRVNGLFRWREEVKSKSIKNAES